MTTIDEISAPMNVSHSEIATCTGNVRWHTKTGKLQQLFTIQKITDGYISDVCQVWRDVPTDDA